MQFTHAYSSVVKVAIRSVSIDKILVYVPFSTKDECSRCQYSIRYNFLECNSFVNPVTHFLIKGMTLTCITNYFIAM